MTLLLYGIADDEPAARGEAGLDGERLDTVRYRELVAIVGTEPEPAHPANLDRLLRYERVIETLTERQAVLPARFGSRSPGPVQLCERLEQQYDQLLAALQRVRGAVELAVRAQWRDPGSPPSRGHPDNGTGYMLGRVDRHRRATAVARHLDPLATQARACRTRVLPQPELAWSGAYLVESGRLDQFAETLGDIDSAIEQVDFVCTGPWPPYSFVGGAVG
jgi:hypothetical protein